MCTSSCRRGPSIPAKKGGIQTNPLIVGRTLYAYTPTQKVIALDAATGKLKWKFDSGINGTQPARGFGYWTQTATARPHLRRRHELPLLPRCRDRQADRNLRRERPHRPAQGPAADPTRRSPSRSPRPGVIYKDLIIVGGREPETHPAPPGDIRAFDVRTGALRWTFHTIPLPGEPGYETWPKDAWKTAGAANNWAGMALDAERGIVYVPTGSAVMDFYGGDRVGDDLFANTLLALDANTGKRSGTSRACITTSGIAIFPRRPRSSPSSATARPIDAIAQTTKQGYLYLFDRVTGKPLFPISEQPYPASDVPGEVTSPTQPLPDWPAPFARQRLTEDMLTTRTPEAHAWAVKQFAEMRSGGQFVPMTLDKQTVVFPGFDGGAEWGGPAVDPVPRRPLRQRQRDGLARRPRCAERRRQPRRSSSIASSAPSATAWTAPARRPHSRRSSTSRSGSRRSKIARHACTTGTGRMPSFPNIDDAHLTALLDFLRTRRIGAEDKKEMASAPAGLVRAGAFRSRRRSRL